ncbi:MAG: hypothetical protein ACLRT4_14445 [Thomasclavelia sp.]
MNEMYIISILMLYTLIVLIDTLLRTYQLFEVGLATDEERIFRIKPVFISYISNITPMNLRINWKKDYRLNMKRRPPIISVAH